MTQDEINAIAARVILIEGDALHQMAGDLPSDFASAVEAILQTSGRVIVSGVGKSCFDFLAHSFSRSLAF